MSDIIHVSVHVGEEFSLVVSGRIVRTLIMLHFINVIVYYQALVRLYYMLDI